MDDYFSWLLPDKQEGNQSENDSALPGINNLQGFLEQHLARFDAHPEVQGITQQKRSSLDGRIGSNTVALDTSSQSGSMNIKDQLEIDSQSNFSSIRANVCVCKGKWMYEVYLGSVGIMQLGWATIRCRFTNEEGVGDTPDSYAYDGRRVCKWNISTAKYGEEWIAGDIISCLIDLDEGTISYHRNGRDLGIAFQDIKRGTGVAYFPAISLSFSETVHLNFGATPFRFPCAGYKSLQGFNMSDYLKTKYLVTALERFLPSPTREVVMIPLVHKEVVPVLITLHLFQQLVPLLNDPYMIEALILPLFLNSCQLDSDHLQQPGVQTLLNLIRSCMEPESYRSFIEDFVWTLVKSYWYGPVSPQYQRQLNHITLAYNLLLHQPTRLVWLSRPIFSKFPYLLHVRPPDDKGIMEAIPDLWWEGIEDINSGTNPCAKEKFFASCRSITKRVEVLELIQVEMCKVLLTKDGSRIDQSSCSRMLFLDQFRKMLQNQHTTASSFHPCQPGYGPVMACFLQRLIRALRYHWDSGNPGVPSAEAYVPHHVFYEESVNYFELPRVGGLASHLKKVHRDDLSAVYRDVSKTHLFLRTPVEEEKGLTAPVTGACSSLPPNEHRIDIDIVELLDGLILLYHLSVHKQLQKVHGLCETLRQHSRALKETAKKIQMCPVDREDIMAELQRTHRVFFNVAMGDARDMGWIMAVIFSQEKMEDYHWLLRCTLKTLEAADAFSGQLFSFVPEFYMESAINIFHALWNFFIPIISLSSVEGFDLTLQRIAIFLANSSSDNRVISPDLKDNLVQALLTFFYYPTTLAALESIPDNCKDNMMRSLMLGLDKRIWVQTTWILVRIWKGDGFGFQKVPLPLPISIGVQDQSYTRIAAQRVCPSKVFQAFIRKTCLSDSELSTNFLNWLLNQVNWAFSEFVGIIQEFQQLNSPVETSVDARQTRTCCICFDVTVALLRVLECVCSIVPDLFTDSSRAGADLAISRLFQAVIQILNRVTSGSKRMFDVLESLRSPEMDYTDHFSIMSAIAGVLVALIVRAPEPCCTRALQALVAESSLQMDALQQLVYKPSGAELVERPEATSTSFPTPPEHKFTFWRYNEVSESEIHEVEEMVSAVTAAHTHSSLEHQDSLDSDNVCPICYASLIAAQFVPCGHKSCRPCIARHLMNNKQCFFCKETIASVQDV